MRLHKFFLILLATGLTFSIFADDSNPNSKEAALNERDLQALKDFLRQKRQDAIETKPNNNLTITGDVRTEWRHLNEKHDHHLVRGGDAVDCKCIPYSRNDFDIEANMLMIYNTERTWATIHLQYDNAAGIDVVDCKCDKDADKFCRCNRFHGSGDQHNLNLKRAFMGMNVWSCGDNHFDVELGRRRLYDVFDSEIQFLNRFDGILLKYAGSSDCWGDYYAKLAGFVVDERVNHFAWATEIGFLNIRDSGFDVKYSFIDWVKRGIDRCFEHNPKWAKYCNSQLTLSYHLDPEIFCRPVEIFGAVLYNHTGNQVQIDNCLVVKDDDEESSFRKCFGGECVPVKDIENDDEDDEDDDSRLSSEHHHDKKYRNWAWYAGILIGEVEKEGDWSFEFQYQWVQENAIAWDDQNGIGIGDFNAECCGNKPTPGYKGWLIDILYGITDDITVDLTLESTRKNQPGEYHTYSKCELEAIYAF